MTLGNQDLTLAGVLTLTKGIILTGSQKFILPPASATFGNANSYIDGNVQITTTAINQTLTFPTGGGGMVGQARLNNVSLSGTTFVVKYNPTAHPFSSISVMGIETSLDAYWDITRSGAASSAQVELFWDNSFGNIMDRTKLLVLPRMEKVL